MRASAVSMVLLLSCKAPPALEDATPDSEDLADASLADLFPLLFRDEAQPTDRLRDLIDALERQLTAEQVDMSAQAPADREFSLEPLPASMLGEVVPPPDTDPSHQNSVVVFGRGEHGFDDLLQTQLETNQVCIESHSTVFYRRSYNTDTACFVDGTCDSLSTVAEVRKELSILDAGWYDFRKDFRRLALADGRRVLLARGWLPAVYPLERGGTAYQTYSLEAWVERDAGLDRTYALWGEMDIGLGDAAMRDLTTDALHEALERQDLFADGGDPAQWCNQDRDRPYDRPQN